MSAHFKHGSPTFTDNGLTLTMTSSLAGLGNYDTQVSISATGQPTATCTNPAGQTQPPGQNPATVTLTGTTLVPASDIKNGNVTIPTTTSAPTSPVPGAPACPNRQWTETITDVSFTSVSFSIAQDTNANGAFEESPSIQGTCTFAPSTSNGSVPSGSVSC